MRDVRSPASALVVRRLGRRERHVGRELLVVHSEAVALGVGVDEQAGLEDRVWGGFNVGNEMSGGEGELLGMSGWSNDWSSKEILHLFNLIEEVLWVPI